MFLLSQGTICLSLPPFYAILEHRAKMNDHVPNDRLGTSRFNEGSLKIYPYEPTSNLKQKIENL